MTNSLSITNNYQHELDPEQSRVQVCAFLSMESFLQYHHNHKYIPLLLTSVGKQWPQGFALSVRPTNPKRLSSACKVRATLGASDKSIGIPNQWYNVIADLPVKPPPPLHPKTYEPIKPDDLSPLFPDELIRQEIASDRFIDIPDEVLDVYKLWRPTPLIRYLGLIVHHYVSAFPFCYLEI